MLEHNFTSASLSFGIQGLFLLHESCSLDGGSTVLYTELAWLGGSLLYYFFLFASNQGELPLMWQRPGQQGHLYSELQSQWLPQSN